MIERIMIVIFCLIALMVIILVKPITKYFAFLETHFIYHECYRKDKDTGKEYGEKIGERVYMLFWTYFILSSLLGLCLYFTQLGLIGIGEPFKWSTYFIAAGFLCFLARGIKTTPFLEEDKKGIAPSFINHTFGLALVGSFLVLIHFSFVWITNPTEIYKLMHISFNVEFVLFDIIIGVLIIWVLPLFFASVGEAMLFLICKFLKVGRKGIPKERV